MSKLKSIFGDYADNIQMVIDKRNDRFDPLWYPQYFKVGTPQMSLTYTSIIGASRIEAVASVVDRNSKTPLRNRPDLNKLSGEVAAIKEMFHLKESDMREYENLKLMPTISDAEKEDTILQYIWDDTRKAGNSVYKRIDMMCLEAISTGQISLDVVNNPDGVVLANPIDLLMPSANITQSAVTWVTSNTATPITDIKTKINAARGRGIRFAKLLMSDVLFTHFSKTKEVLDTLTAFFYGPKPGTGFNPTGITTLDSVNTYLTAARLPIIEIVDAVFGVENKGIISPVTPFSQDNVSFIPMGQLGTIKTAVAMEEIRKVENVVYAKFDKALISKWHENEPLQEWTKAEWNAFPSVEAIDSIFILEAVHA